jgi:hypothetical protein
MYQTILDPTNFVLKLKMDPEKQLIINLFETNVKGQNIDLSEFTGTHDGREGHWLERRMGVVANANNAPDLHGYEMKKSAPTISFGDWSADEYLFSKRKIFLPQIDFTRNEFINAFGTPNLAKDGRVSWSGKCFPKVGDYNECGQKLKVTDDGAVVAYYSPTHDMRPTKATQGDGRLPIAFWSAEKLGLKITSKFGVKGFFVCKKVGATYQKICFGKPISTEFFLEQMRLGNIFIDSGMYEGNSRNYSQFRASRSFWDSLITEEY